jgi:hypothetical protein
LWSRSKTVSEFFYLDMMVNVSKLIKRHPFPITGLVVSLLLVVILLSGFWRAGDPTPVAVRVTTDQLATSALLSRLTPTITAEPVHESTAAQTTSYIALPITPESAATPTPESPVPYIGMWISQAELAALPVEGPAWDNLMVAAEQDTDDPEISDQNDLTDVYVLAKALVYARTGALHHREEAIATIEEAMGSEEGSEALALSRNLVSYIIAADLINLPAADPELDVRFQEWLRRLLTEPMSDDRSLRETHEIRPNNFGTHAGASRVAIALYLEDMDELERAANVFKGWLGDRGAYTGFEFGRQDWQADPDNPVGINPPGAMKEGIDLSGALPEEMRRSGRFDWPPHNTGYSWEALQGAIVTAELLERAGYPVWEWEQQALLRAVEFLYDIEWPAEGDDEWQPWLINDAYGTDFPVTIPARPGKNMGWTDWTHG